MVSTETPRMMTLHSSGEQEGERDVEKQKDLRLSMVSCLFS